MSQIPVFPIFAKVPPYNFRRMVQFKKGPYSSPPPNDRCMSAIIRYLNWDQLIVMSKVSKRFEDLIMQHYNEKYGLDETGAIRGTFNPRDLTRNGQPATQDELIEFLSIFGSTIASATINSSFEENGTNVWLIEDSCPNLISLNINEFGPNDKHAYNPPPVEVIPIKPLIDKLERFSLHTNAISDGLFDEDTQIKHLRIFESSPPVMAPPLPKMPALVELELWNVVLTFEIMENWCTSNKQNLERLHLHGCTINPGVWYGIPLLLPKLSSFEVIGCRYFFVPDDYPILCQWHKAIFLKKLMVHGGNFPVAALINTFTQHRILITHLDLKRVSAPNNMLMQLRSIRSIRMLHIANVRPELKLKHVFYLVQYLPRASFRFDTVDATFFQLRRIFQLDLMTPRLEFVFKRDLVFCVTDLEYMLLDKLITRNLNRGLTIEMHLHRANVRVSGEYLAPRPKQWLIPPEPEPEEYFESGDEESFEGGSDSDECTKDDCMSDVCVYDREQSKILTTSRRLFERGNL